MAFVERVSVTHDHVVPRKQAASICGVSTDTLDRLSDKGEGPRRLKLSARRVGYRMSDIEAWLQSLGVVAS
jgi:predicted DNA-binding transcriptional regulator AlpA